MGYSGSGYAVDPTTGEPLPVYTIQDYINSRVAGSQPSITVKIFQTFQSLGVPIAPQSFWNAVLSSYNENTSPLPKTLDLWVDSLAYAVNIANPAMSIANAKGPLKQVLLEVMSDRLGLTSTSVDAAAIAAALQDPALQPNSATFLDDVAELSFDQFLSTYDYSSSNGASIAGTFEDVFNAYTVQIATISNTNGANINFDQIYKGFFGSDTAAFTSFLANYINSIVYSTGGAATDPFSASEDIGGWLKKVQEAYSIALYGSAAPTTSSVGNSFKKVVIIDQILRLIIKMIGTLQKVASMQSDRLRILTLQQSAYTTLLTQVPVFTSGDGTIFGGNLASTDEMQRARDQANNYNQTLSETVRSRRTTVQDDAKVLQSNINQSNDSANDQASTATALLQTLSTILGAIYR